MPVQADRESYVKQIRDVPTFGSTKLKIKFPAWKKNFLCLANLHGLLEIFTVGVDLPVADEGMSVPALQQAFPAEDIRSTS